MNGANGYSASDDAPVEAALADYFNRVDRGESVELTEIIAAHPGCESGLRQFLNQERKLHEVVAVVSLPSAAPENLTGRTLGDFRLERVIGRGGMGVVWQAKQLSLGRTAAVKLLPAALCSDSRHRARFQNEARILAQLEHANIVNVLAVGEDADTYYFAMQYVEGMTADELIQLWKEKSAPHDAETARGLITGDTTIAEPGEPLHKRTSGQLPPWVAHCGDRRERYRMCARIAAEVADGLAHAHACGVLHRDVKPSNILLDKTGTARLSDFGLARMCGDATLTATGAILGTLRYASPEQLGGTSATIDERSDVYSLGVTLWELVTGQRLFMAENHNTVISQVLNVDAPRPSSFAARLPRDLETVIARAMAKEPRDRYVSAQAFTDDLRRFLAGRPIQAKPITLGERAFRWANRNRVLAASAIGSLVVLAAVALVTSALILGANSRTAAALATSQGNEQKAHESAVAAEASERKTRELLYTADMALAGAAWHKNEPAQVRMILDRYATPKARDDGSTDDPRGFEWYFLDRQVRPQSDVLFQNDEALFVIEFMPGGNEFLTAGRDSVVRWHDSGTGKVARSLDTHQTEINSVSYNPSRTVFVTAGDDGTVKIWNAADFSLLHSIKAYNGKCCYAKFVSDALIFAGGEEKIQRLYDPVTGDLVREFASPEAKSSMASAGASWHADVSKAGDRVWTVQSCAAGVCQGVYEWNLNTGASRRIYKTAGGLVNILADRSQKFLFVMTHDDIRICDATSGDELQSFRLPKLEAMALSPDERRLLAGDQNGQIHVWNLDLSKRPESPAAGTSEKFSVHNRDVYGITFAPDGQTLFTVGTDGAVRRTKLGARKEAFRELTSLKDRVCIPIPGSDRVVAVGNAPFAVLERATGKVIRRFSSSHYQAAAVSSDGALVAAASTGHLGVWNLSTGKRVLAVDQKRVSVLSMRFSTDNRLLAVLSRDSADGRLDIVEVATGHFERCPIAGTIASPWNSGYYFWTGNDLVIWLSTPGTLIRSNVRDWTTRWETKPREQRVVAASMSPDRNSLLTTDSQVLTLQDCETRNVRYQAPCAYSIRRLAYTADGRSIVVGGEQGQLSVWHAVAGQPLFEIANLGTPIESIQPLENGFLASTKRVKDGRTELVWLEF